MLTTLGGADCETGNAGFYGSLEHSLINILAGFSDGLLETVNILMLSSINEILNMLP